MRYCLIIRKAMNKIMRTSVVRQTASVMVSVRVSIDEIVAACDGPAMGLDVKVEEGVAAGLDCVLRIVLLDMIVALALDVEEGFEEDKDGTELADD
jgi:hypothetical protein